MNTDLVRKLLFFDKSILLWARKTGKTLIIFEYLNNYIQENKNKDILFFCDNMKSCDYTKKKLFKFFNIIVRYNEKYIYLINNNKLKFCSIISEYYKDLHYTKPELIIFDEISKNTDIKYFDDLIHFIIHNGYNKHDPCKCLLTGTYINSNLIKSIDRYNDFYINFKKQNNKPINNFDFNFDCVPLDINFFSYKPTNLLDVDDIRYERKKKLIKINELSKKLKEEKNGRKM